MKQTLIVYGSTGGNTQIVCETVAAFLEEKGGAVLVQRCERTAPEDIQKADALILACPTYGHGVLEPHFATFFQTIQTLDLAQKPCAVIALGDPKYDLDYFLESEKILKKYIETHNGQTLVPSLKIAKNPYMYLEKFIGKWADSYFQALKKIV